MLYPRFRQERRLLGIGTNTKTSARIRDTKSASAVLADFSSKGAKSAVSPESLILRITFDINLPMLASRTPGVEPQLGRVKPAGLVRFCAHAWQSKLGGLAQRIHRLGARSSNSIEQAWPETLEKKELRSERWITGLLLAGVMCREDALRDSLPV